MGSKAVVVALLGGSLALVGACSGGTSAVPPQSNTGLNCLSYPLTDDCCSEARPACPATFATAGECATWPNSKVTIFPYECDGLLAVSVIADGADSAMVYAYDSTTQALYAIGDDAASNVPGSLALECGAGPQGFSFPSACSQEWLDPSQGSACTAGTDAPTSVCQ